jgi:hypothetical protein
MKPFPVALPHRRVDYRPLIFHTEKEVDGSLLIGV